MEYGGAEGSTVLFLCEALDGKLFDIVAKDGTVLASPTVEDFISGRLAGLVLGWTVENRI